MDKACVTYVEEVLKFRKALNLTSISKADVFDHRFIQPSLALSEWLPEQGRLLDIGSGMGIPGIPLLIARPKLQGVLVERRKKRAEFLRHIVRLLKLNAEVYDEDVNSLPCLHVDACVARAVADELHLLKMCSAHANPDARAILPVPRDSKAVQADDWSVEGEYIITMSGQLANDNGDAQLIRCYRFVGKSAEGFT